jgi:hypothetical protein
LWCHRTRNMFEAVALAIVGLLSLLTDPRPSASTCGSDRGGGAPHHDRVHSDAPARASRRKARVDR